MINTNAIIMKAYISALSAISAPVYFVVPNNISYPYVLIDILERGGDDVETRTKQNRNATEVEVLLRIVTGTTAGGGAKEVDLIATEILLIALPTDPLTKLNFSPIENVTASFDGSTYGKEWNDTHFLITKEIVIKHLLSQP